MVKRERPHNQPSASYSVVAECHLNNALNLSQRQGVLGTPDNSVGVATIEILGLRGCSVFTTSENSFGLGSKN